MKLSKISLLILTLFFQACSMFEYRTYEDEMNKNEEAYVPGKDFRVVQGDSGKKNRSYSEVMERIPLDGKAKEKYQNTAMLRRELEELENALSQDEYYNYMKYREDLQTVSEKIYFLKLKGRARDNYAQARGMGDKNNMGFEPDPFYDAVMNREVGLGMDKDAVMKSWGRPTRVDVAGDPRHQNERWGYYSEGRYKFVYFNKGRVEGWDDGN